MSNPSPDKQLDFQEAVPGEPNIPESLFILPISDLVVFPLMVVSVYVTNPTFLRILSEKLENNEAIGLVTYKGDKKEVPPVSNLYKIGTYCKIEQIIKGQKANEAVILVEGIKRFEIEHFTQETPFLAAEVHDLVVDYEKNEEADVLSLEIKKLLEQASGVGKQLPPAVLQNLSNINNYNEICNFASSYLNLPTEQKQKLLEMTDTIERMKALIKELSREIHLFKVRGKIHTEVEKEMNKTEREFLLRQEMKAIQKELGEEDEDGMKSSKKEIEHLKKQIKKAEMPTKVEEVALKELDRLSRIFPISPEYEVVHNYIEWLINLPWKTDNKSTIDIKKARKILDEDHYGLEEIKERILEYLAVCQLQKKPGVTIMCFVGPPGVGKSSLGRSIARSLNREFIQMSLGGMHDEAEIRGHRRTYVGAMPGQIIQNIRNAGQNNPVFMLDEIDKLGNGNFQGDPASALLEVLDPELNFAFRDHYLDVPYDLSNVLFITTANILQTIPPALLDRMEVIRLPGYVEEEKIQIAKKYLLQKEIKRNGLTKYPFTIDDDAIAHIARHYTREAGVRLLERAIAKICRKVAKKMLETKKKVKKITKEDIEEYLGVERYLVDDRQQKDTIGVATGLAWTEAGGEIIFIESTKMPGKGILTLTGQLGDVMQESAHAALSYIRSNASKYKINKTAFAKNDIHIHIPQGAIPKDGPSAGSALALSLISLLTDRKIKKDVALTGEITLRGNVIAIGGLKEKVLAAKRSHIKTIIVPHENKKDITEIPKHLIKGLTFVYAKTLDDVIQKALVKKSTRKSAKN